MSYFVVSGEVPEDPVVSKNTGHVFEKRLIEKLLAAEGKCPITGAAMSEEDLLPLKCKVVPKSFFSVSFALNGLFS